MAETRPLPTNYWTQRKTRSMTPSDRHVGAFLWTNRNTTSCGVYQIDVAEVAIATGYDVSTTNTHMNNLVANGHILWDEETAEVFILDWFRYHKFKGAGKSILIRDLKQIESLALKNAAIKSILENEVISEELLGFLNNQRVNLPTEQNTTEQNTTTTEATIHKKLRFAYNFTPSQKNEISKIVGEFDGDLAQDLVDELSGLAKEGKIKRTPLALLFTLTRKAREGKFVKTYALNVQAWRHKQTEHAPSTGGLQ